MERIDVMRLHRLVATVAVVALATAACSAGSAPGWTYPAPASPAPAPTAAAGVDQPNGTAGSAEGALAGTLAFESFDLGFTPAMATVPAAGTYEVKLVNTGSIIHDVTFADGTVVAAEAGRTATGTVTVPAEGIAFICSIPGHKDAGMTGMVTVEGAATPAEGEGGESHGGPAPTTDVEADPDAPAYAAFDPAAPAPLEGTVHDIDLVVEEKAMTVAEGFVQKVWTFGGTVPGPVLRVKVGDTVRIHLKNPATSQLPHSVDFHSSMVAWNDEMTSINPGEEKLYEFKAEFAGIWMYHCGTSPALHHIANGMYGMMIVEPKEGLEPVDQEFAFVQNEWYLGPQGEPASLTKASAAAPAPDYVTFNGIANQYLDNPIQVATGERVRVFVLDAGPSIDSSFHIVGTIFDRVIKEGVELEVGNAGGWGAQAVDLSPAQGAMVEFTLAEDGLYPIVTHAFNFVGRGALGLFQAGDGDPLN
jgi:nitrite reductase (NO-forming)